MTAWRPTSWKAIFCEECLAAVAIGIAAMLVQLGAVPAPA